jgi:hypothetical protein
MEDNPLILRLKELETLERLVEKVGRIDLHAGEGRGLDALLTGLVRMKADEPARDRKRSPMELVLRRARIRHIAVRIL